MQKGENKRSYKIHKLFRLHIPHAYFNYDFNAIPAYFDADYIKTFKAMRCCMIYDMIMASFRQALAVLCIALDTRMSVLRVGFIQLLSL